VILDPGGRVLLLRYDDPPPMGVHWATPGGGIDPGETPRDAAGRELREETGWSDVEVGRELGTTHRTVCRGTVVEQHETHFAVHVDAVGRQLDETGHAVDEIAGWRWFDRADLPPQPVWPAELPALIAAAARRVSP
jgi:ADP-ribose pyrophosphatase YjhB (NUDIX family)